MIDQTPQKKVLKIDLQKITSFLDVLKKYLTVFYNFFKDNKNNSKIMLIIAITTSALAIFFGIQLYSDITSLNAKSSVLNNLSSYDTRTLEADPITQTIIKNSDTIKDVLQENTATE